MRTCHAASVTGMHAGHQEHERAIDDSNGFSLVQTREKIEGSGRESRWEFSKTALFEHTSHMAQMCSALLSMLTTTHALNEFLGPQLEAVTGGSQVTTTSQKTLFTKKTAAAGARHPYVC